MKWHNRTAQVFRPGEAPPVTRPERATESSGSNAAPDDRRYMINTGQDTLISAALAGRMLQRTYPGLKTWAILLSHFMAVANEITNDPFI